MQRDQAHIRRRESVYIPAVCNEKLQPILQWSFVILLALTRAPSSSKSGLFPAHLECLQGIMFLPHLEGPPVWLPPLVPSLLLIWLLEWHESHLLCQRLLSFCWQQVVWNVLQMSLLSRRPPQVAVVPQMGKLCWIFLEVPWES